MHLDERNNHRLHMSRTSFRCSHNKLHFPVSHHVGEWTKNYVFLLFKKARNVENNLRNVTFQSVDWEIIIEKNIFLTWIGFDNETTFSKYGRNSSISQSIESIVSSDTVVRYNISGSAVWSNWRCWKLYIRCSTSFSPQYTGKTLTR